MAGVFYVAIQSLKKIEAAVVAVPFDVGVDLFSAE